MFNPLSYVKQQHNAGHTAPCEWGDTGPVPSGKGGHIYWHAGAERGRAVHLPFFCECVNINWARTPGCWPWQSPATSFTFCSSSHIPLSPLFICLTNSGQEGGDGGVQGWCCPRLQVCRGDREGEWGQEYYSGA